MQYKLIIFDYDGTLVDSHRFHMLTIYDVLKSCGSTGTIEQMRECMGISIKRILENMLPEEKRQEAAETLERFYCHVPDKWWPEVKVIDGAFDVLKAVRQAGMKTALVTNSHHRLVDASLEHFGFKSYFDWVIAADERAHKKEERLELLLQLSGVKKSDCLFVGDTASDMIDCRSAGFDAVLVDDVSSWIRIYPTLPEGFVPDWTVDSLRKIPALLGI